MKNIQIELELSNETADQLRKIGESSISDLKMLDKVAELIGEEKAIKYMLWLVD